MTQDTQILFAVLIYLSFFAWIGWRRTAKAEVTVFIVAVGSWILLQERGTVFVRITNLGVKFLRLLGGSLASGEVDEGSLSGQPNLINPGGEETFLFIIWVLILFGTYVITSRPGFLKGTKKTAWGAIWGALNGLLLLAVLLPRLTALYVPGPDPEGTQPLRTFWTLLTEFLRSLWTSLLSLWHWLQPLNPTALLIIITAILTLAALTLRRGAKAKT